MANYRIEGSSGITGRCQAINGDHRVWQDEEVGRARTALFEAWDKQWSEQPHTHGVTQIRARLIRYGQFRLEDMGGHELREMGGHVAVMAENLCYEIARFIEREDRQSGDDDGDEPAIAYVGKGKGSAGAPSITPAIIDYQSQIDRMQAQIDELKDALRERSQPSSAEDRLAAASDQLGEMRGRLEEIEQRHTEQLAALERGLGERIAALTEQLEEARAGAADRAQLEQELAALREKLESRHAGQMEELQGGLEAKIDDLSRQLEEALAGATDRDRLEQELAALREKFEDFKAQKALGDAEANLVRSTSRLVLAARPTEADRLKEAQQQFRATLERAQSLPQITRRRRVEKGLAELDRLNEQIASAADEAVRARLNESTENVRRSTDSLLAALESEIPTLRRAETFTFGARSEPKPIAAELAPPPSKSTAEESAKAKEGLESAHTRVTDALTSLTQSIDDFSADELHRAIVEAKGVEEPADPLVLKDLEAELAELSQAADELVAMAESSSVDAELQRAIVEAKEVGEPADPLVLKNLEAEIAELGKAADELVAMVQSASVDGQAVRVDEVARTVVGVSDEKFQELQEFVRERWVDQQIARDTFSSKLERHLQGASAREAGLVAQPPSQQSVEYTREQREIAREALDKKHNEQIESLKGKERMAAHMVYLASLPHGLQTDAERAEIEKYVDAQLDHDSYSRKIAQHTRVDLFQKAWLAKEPQPYAQHNHEQIEEFASLGIYSRQKVVTLFFESPIKDKQAIVEGRAPIPDEFADYLNHPDSSRAKSGVNSELQASLAARRSQVDQAAMPATQGAVKQEPKKKMVDERQEVVQPDGSVRVRWVKRELKDGEVVDPPADELEKPIMPTDLNEQLVALVPVIGKRSDWASFEADQAERRKTIQETPDAFLRGITDLRSALRPVSRDDGVAQEARRPRRRKHVEGRVQAPGMMTTQSLIMRPGSSK